MELFHVGKFGIFGRRVVGNLHHSSRVAWRFVWI
jgi:hypothetical protein